jgi:hypothetical protein
MGKLTEEEKVEYLKLLLNKVKLPPIENMMAIQAFNLKVNLRKVAEIEILLVKNKDTKCTAQN